MNQIQIKRYINHKPHVRGNWHKEGETFYTWQEEDYQKELAYLKACTALEHENISILDKPQEVIREGFEVSLYKELRSYLNTLEHKLSLSIEKPTYKDLQKLIKGYLVLAVRESWTYDAIALSPELYAFGSCDTHEVKAFQSFADFNQQWAGKEVSQMFIYLLRNEHKCIREHEDGHRSFLSRFLGS
ncbi:hypothetical protein WKV52_05585 [Tetragenococcus halophilus]|uniref:hypothetical protein n=1 Tax=Tetragenococcus halophilus TaxID=51669 RepID=UPI001031A281